jgi:hypothetical protein
MEAGVATNETTETRAVVEGFLDALSRVDLDALLDAMADDVRWEVMGADFMPHGDVYEGKQAFQTGLLADAQELYDMSTFKLDATLVAVEGADAAVEWVVEAKTSGGRDYRNRYSVICTVANGHIQSVREYTDTRYAERLLLGDVEPVSVVERFLDAFRLGDAEKLVACLSDDVVWQPMGMDFLPNGSRYEGKQAFLNDFLPDALALYDMSTWQFDGRVVASDGPVVVVEWVVKAKSARGRDYENRYCVVLTVAGDGIRDVREYTDTGYMKRVLVDD